MAKVLFVDRKAPSLLVGDGNAHHEEWLGSSKTTVHNGAALDFASSSGCERRVMEPTNINGVGLYFAQALFQCICFVHLEHCAPCGCRLRNFV